MRLVHVASWVSVRFLIYWGNDQPAVKRRVIGVFGAACVALAEVSAFGRACDGGSRHDGLDEITISGTTSVAELKDGAVIEYKIKPQDFDIAEQTLEGLSVTSAEQSLALIQDALGKCETEAGEKAADIIALNAGAAIYVSGVASILAEGVAMAQDAIGSGLAKEKITELAAYTRCQKDAEAV